MTGAIPQSPLGGLNALDRRTLWLLGLLSAIKALALIGMASALATGVVSIIGDTSQWRSAVAIGLVSALARAATTWARGVVAARALLGAKERLRAELAERVVADGGSRVGSTTTLATRGLDELDSYLTVFLPVLIDAACIPLLIGARILFADWISALIIVLTVPLIPVFMTLIGMHTRERVAAATDALARLSDHLVELARGLPVLVGLGRAQEQTAALRTISEEYRSTTVQTLRTAFLSSLALEMIATISVALVAVTIGVRLVAGDLSLEVGLLALLLAPECFLPFRQIGAAFHASEDGREALGRVRGVLDAPRTSRFATAGPGAVYVDRLSVSYPDRALPAVAEVSFTAPIGQITVLDGASGSGKSTLFAVLTGQLTGADGTHISGRITGVDAARLAWLPQHPHTVGDTVLEELTLYGETDDRNDTAVVEAGAWAVLDRLGLAHLADADPARLSPGELRRLAFGRVLARVSAGADLVVLDEPTAHLDAASAAILIAEISALRAHTAVIVAAHDPAVRTLADRVVLLGRDTPTMSVSTLADVPERERSRRGTAAAVTTSLPQHPLRELTAILRPVRGRIAGAIALGTLATLFAVSLTALSGWLIVRASQEPPIMYLLVAIVGVRFFGIGRAVLRYGERLIGHDAVFAALTGLRMRLWRGLAAHGAADRAVLGGGNALDRLIGDTDRLRDLSLRVILPPITGVLTVGVAIAGLGIIFPAAVPLFLGLAGAALLLAPVLALAADRSAARRGQRLRAEVLRRFASMLAATGELRANAVDRRVRDRLGALDTTAGMADRRSAWALGLGSALVVFACGAAAILILPLTAGSVADGSLRPELVAVLALTPLGLIDPLLDVVAAVQHWPAFREVLERTAPITHQDAASSSGRAVPPSPVTNLRLDGLAVSWPRTSSPVFTDLAVNLERGQWLVVTGPSGSGKSTLLTALLGYLRPSSGHYLLNGIDTATMDPALLRRRIAWCPQEGHLFDSTLRANLLLARRREEAPDTAEMTAVLHRVGLGELLEHLPLGLDTPIGAGGGHLSGGERQRVAVARTILTRAEVILIDEPTAHLDEESAARLMADLRVALRDTVTVLVTHHTVDIAADDVRLDLADPTAVLRAPQFVGGAA